MDLASFDVRDFNSGRADGLRRQVPSLSVLHTKHVNISLVVAYAPTNDKDDAVKEEFYNQLSSVLDRLPRQDVVFLGGVFNARVGGGHSFHQVSNDNGERLEDLCAIHQLSIGGKMLPHRDHHKGTWRSPDGTTVTQIDHLCVGNKWRSSLLDDRILRSADIGSDHYLVRGNNIRLGSG
eukprot:sb/3471737/